MANDTIIMTRFVSGFLLLLLSCYFTVVWIIEDKKYQFNIAIIAYVIALVLICYGGYDEE